MNLEEQKKSGLNQIYLADSLNAPLMGLKIKSTENTLFPTGDELIVYVDKQDMSNPSDERKTFVFELQDYLQYFNSVSDEFVLALNVKDYDITLDAYVERKIGVNENTNYLLSEPVIENIDGSLINLFEGVNYIYTNYSAVQIELIYPKNNEFNKLYLNSALYYNHKINNDGEFGLDDIYFKDAFTKTEDKLNLNVDHATIECLSSKNNKFSLDANGNLVVNSIITNDGNNQLDEESICNLIYPVGSIYMSVNSVNPSTLFGGTWEQLKDKFLLSSGDTYSLGSTGGAANVTLTTEQIPSHTHNWSQSSCSNPGNHTHIVGADKDGGPGSNRYTVHITNNNTAYGQEYSPTSGGAGSHTHTITGTNTSVGGGQSHNNMPPYLVVNVWKRTA